VKLMNLDNLVLIGPGSEWFWSAASAVAVVVTLLALYRQLRLQRIAAALAQLTSLTEEWRSERIDRAYLTLLLAIERDTAPADMPEAPLFVIGDFFDKIALQVRTGTTDVRLIHETISGPMQIMWARMRPTVMTWRQRTFNREMYLYVEELAATMARMDKRRGWSVRTDDEYLAARLPGLIAQVRGNIELHESLRTLPVQLTSTPLAVSVVREAA
jgi:hypothetical protein